jgi:hypothetical protein
MVQQPASHRLAYALIFITPALWCVNYLVARWSPGVVAPNTLAFGRWLVAALLLGAFTAPELWRQRALLRAQWQRFVVLGALGMWICGAWVYIAARTTTATNIALIYSVSPVADGRSPASARSGSWCRNAAPARRRHAASRTEPVTTSSPKARIDAVSSL